MEKRYPEDLVHKYGAKAGLLLYISKELPEIPQTPMIVKEDDETVNDFLKRANKNSIGWPRLYRSTSPLELDGYDGVFKTYLTHWRLNSSMGPKERSIQAVNDVINSARELQKRGDKDPNLSGDIGVIATQHSKSKYIGTCLHNPNQKDFFIITISDFKNPSNPKRAMYFKFPGKKVEFSKRFTLIDEIKESHRINEGLETVVSWHDKIASLPEMDPNWSYILEFGIMPECFYDIKFFKENSFADFHVKPYFDPKERFVIGITPEEGLTLRVEEREDVWERSTKQKKEINPEGVPSAFLTSLKSLDLYWMVPNLKANLAEEAYGVFEHGGISAIRNAQVSVFSNLGFSGIEQGDWINLTSDGINAEIEKIENKV
jgi:hypothetical protein